ncbi:MAG: ATP-binding protein [Anaeromyxobacteraceae bacterium]
MSPDMLPDGDEADHFDRKSLRKVTGRTADWHALAGDCVAFANAAGGRIYIGIEDDTVAPPPRQIIDQGLPDLIKRRVGELTANVTLVSERKAHENGGQYVEVHVLRAAGIASTSNGRFFLRVGDESRPLVGDDVARLISERPAIPWESLTASGALRTEADEGKLRSLCSALRSSGRVKQSVKEKTNEELLTHYHLAFGRVLTNLGVLLVGTARQRSMLGTAPVVQFIKYDDRGNKTNKIAWDDYTLSPMELLEAVWRDVPDFRETYEVPDGLLRATIPAFDEAVLREVLVNALAHRPYTQRGDIYLNLHPDRLEIVNPGRLPLGVTPRNILHESRRRNDGLARVLSDLNFMEREGSGFDLIYDRLLQSGRQVPGVKEGTDSVHVTVPRRVVRPEVMRLLRAASAKYELNQRERIALGVLALTEGLTASEFTKRLELPDAEALHPWIDRLIEVELVVPTGRTRATRYFVPPAFLKAVALDLKTTLKRVQPHRLRALILEDLDRYPGSSSSEIHQRVGPEINARTLKRAIDTLIEAGEVSPSGKKRWTKYRLRPGGPKGHAS